MTENPMGKISAYPDSFDPGLLVAIPRSTNRELIGVGNPLPFTGEDVWHAYELSWLNKQGLPRAAIARFFFPCKSPFLIESKSFKLFLNSLNQEKFNDRKDVIALLTESLSKCSGAKVKVELIELNTFTDHIKIPEGICIDGLNIGIEDYHPNSSLLSCNKNNIVQEHLYSDLFKSNCPVTNQPDWASISIIYKGPSISRESLLAYLVSYRLHSDYHENCVEKIFVDIQEKCKPQVLTVQANFLRRGGLDINPIRSTLKEHIKTPCRFIRQ